MLLTELKAAAIDVAAPMAIERGAEVVFVENRPTAAGGDDLDDALRELVTIARERAARPDRMTGTNDEGTRGCW